MFSNFVLTLWRHFLLKTQNGLTSMLSFDIMFMKYYSMEEEFFFQLKVLENEKSMNEKNEKKY